MKLKYVNTWSFLQNLEGNSGRRAASETAFLSYHVFSENVPRTLTRQHCPPRTTSKERGEKPVQVRFLNMGGTET